jgi:hypothetical protein
MESSKQIRLSLLNIHRMHMSDRRSSIAIYSLSFISIFSLSGHNLSIKRRRLNSSLNFDDRNLKLRADKV